MGIAEKWGDKKPLKSRVVEIVALRAEKKFKSILAQAWRAGTATPRQVYMPFVRDYLRLLPIT
jgi:hypothetical protein